MGDAGNDVRGAHELGVACNAHGGSNATVQTLVPGTASLYFLTIQHQIVFPLAAIFLNK